MSEQEKTHVGKKVLAIAVLVLLVLLSVVNLKIVREPLKKFFKKELSFEKFAAEVQKGYLSDDFARKNDFVNINGAFANLTGRRTLNEVVKLNNGMLGRTLNDIDTATMANNIAEFSVFLSERDIPFLYVQMPVKESLDGQSYPVGVTFYGNKNADNLLARLSAAGVKTLDLRPSISQTPEMLEQYFYNTDHHWNCDGAFVAFGEILNYLNELFPNENVDLKYAQTDQWERHIIDNWFLGSHGRRVGTYFGGTDPLIWYTPRFETEMSCAVPSKAWFYRGDYTEANIKDNFTEINYIGYDGNSIYVGGNLPLTQHRNLYAPSSLKVLMLKDSFTTPLQTYLSTVFQEVDLIDPRYFTECSIAEYVERAEPDIVILAINPSVFDNKEYQNYGIEKALLQNAEGSVYELVVQEDIEITARDTQYNYAIYPLESNTVYRVSFADVDILEGHTQGVGLRLYNKTTKKVLESTIFDIAYCKAVNDFSWIFRTPDNQDELELLFYAGIYGSTEGKSVVYRNVTLEKLSGDNTND